MTSSQELEKGDHAGRQDPQRQSWHLKGISRAQEKKDRVRDEGSAVTEKRLDQMGSGRNLKQITMRKTEQTKEKGKG